MDLRRAPALLLVLAFLVQPALASGTRAHAPSLLAPEVTLADAPFVVTGAIGTAVAAGPVRVIFDEDGAGRSVHVLVDGAVAATATTDARGDYRATLSLPRGSYSLTARLADDEPSLPESEPTPVRVAALASAPQGLRAVLGPLPGEVSLTWEAPADDGGIAVSTYDAESWPRASEVGWIGRPTPTSRVLHAVPGEAYTFRVAAVTDPRLPHGAHSDLWSGVPSAPDADTLTLAFDHIRVCTWTGTGRTACEDVAPGGTAFAPTGTWFSVATLRGRVADGGTPAQAALVAAAMGPEGSAAPSFRAATDAEGVFVVETEAGGGAVGAGCTDHAFAAWARLHDLRETAHATVRVCRLADV